MKRRYHSLLISIIWICSLLMGSCTPKPIAPDAGLTKEPDLPKTTVGDTDAKMLQSHVERDLNPQAGSGDLAKLTADNNAFALDFYQELRKKDGNLFFSPYSLSTALAMTYAGARGETERQMAQALHYDLPQAALHPAFNALDLALASLSAGEHSEDEPQPFQLKIANAIWGQVDHPFLPEFLDTLAMNYGAGLRLIDFAHEVERARREINQWVEDQTNDRIKDLIPSGALLDTTRLVLTNAIYFKADWQSPFVKELTIDMPFTRLDGSQLDVPMMGQDEAQMYPYTSGDGYQALELPYVGDEVAMLLLVPDVGNFENFEAGLNAAQVQVIIDQLEPRQVDLRMPKYSFTKELNVKSMLEGLGMTDAFQPQLADFSGMDGERDLYVHNIFHKAFIAVDEKGTEAAAATAVVIGIESYMEPDVQLTIDRPFILLIRDRTSGTILFAGRLLDPSG